MKFWATVLLLIAVAVAAAYGWHSVQLDPGYLLLRVGDTSIETTLVFALIALLLGWAVLSVLWRLLRWPLAMWSQRRRRRGRERLARGLLALVEGRYQQAIRELERAAHIPGLEAAALFAAARAAHARGDDERVGEFLNQAAVRAPHAALALRARFLLEEGQPDQALVLLKPQVEDGKLSPAGWLVLIESALLGSDHSTALAGLAPLVRSQSLAPLAMDALESRVLAAALAGVPDESRLNNLWSGLTRGQRRIPEAVAAYARRAADFGQTLAGMSEVEAALRKDWSDNLVRCYGELGPAEISGRTRTAESWLRAHPNNVTLLLTLGRLCRDQAVWGKTHEYLERALAIEEMAPVWQALGDCYLAQDQGESAATCYRNALRLNQGQLSEPLANRPHRALMLSTAAVVVEERSEHGVPRLPDLARN